MIKGKGRLCVLKHCITISRMEMMMRGNDVIGILCFAAILVVGWSGLKRAR